MLEHVADGSMLALNSEESLMTEVRVQFKGVRLARRQ